MIPAPATVLDPQLALGHAGPMGPEDESSYTCPACGEEIVVTVDSAAGREQEYVEDCPVCCCPVVLRVYVEDGGMITIDPRAE